MGLCTRGRKKIQGIPWPSSGFPSQTLPQKEEFLAMWFAKSVYWESWITPMWWVFCTAIFTKDQSWMARCFRLVVSDRVGNADIQMYWMPNAHLFISLSPPLGAIARYHSSSSWWFVLSLWVCSTWLEDLHGSIPAKWWYYRTCRTSTSNCTVIFAANYCWCGMLPYLPYFASWSQTTQCKAPNIERACP